MARNVDSLGVQKQLNVMFEQRVELENKVLAAMQQELQVALQLQAVMKDLSAEQLTNKLNEANMAFDEMATKATATGDIGEKAMAGIGEKTKEVSTNAGMISKVFGGIGKVMSSLQSTAFGVLGSMLKIGKAVLSIPLGIFNNLMADAAAMSGDTSFMEALEKIRGEFGSFKEETSKNIVGAYKTVNTQLTQMSGLSVWQVFKTPADQLKYLHEMASKAGPMMHLFGSEMAKAGGAMVVFDKGMGIGAENMKLFMERSTVQGVSLQTTLLQTGNYAVQMGKTFGISSKMISTEMGKMMKDTKVWGTINQKEMATAVVYANKLGLAVKDLNGVVEKFDNFDKAAESAALLNQAFGATVDAFSMMNEQNPAKRFDEMKKAMAATGQSSENMTRQQLKLLASTTGMTEEAALLGFSTKNQGISYDEVSKKANKAENAQMKQAEVMKALSDNIERVVHAGTRIAGFWNNFVAGFKIGFKITDEYRGLMFTLRNAMEQFKLAGIEVGKMFMKLTPGVSESFKTFTTLFARDKIKKLLFGFTGEFDGMSTRIGGVIGGFKQIFKGNLEEGFATIKQSFSNFFSSAQTGPILNGLNKFGNFLAKSLGEALSTIAKNAPIYINQLTAFIKDPKGFIDSMKRAGGEGGGMFKAILLSFESGFSKNGPVMKVLYTSLENLLVAVWEMIKTNPKIQEAAKGFLYFQIGRLLMNNVGGMVSATTTIVTNFMSISKAAENTAKAASGAAEATGKASSSMGAAAGKLGAVAAGLAALAAGYAAGKFLGDQFNQGFLDSIEAGVDKAKKAQENSLLNSDGSIHKKNMSQMSLSGEDVDAAKKKITLLQKTVDEEQKKVAGESKLTWNRFSAGLADGVFNPLDSARGKGPRMTMLKSANTAALEQAQAELEGLTKQLSKTAANDVATMLKESGVADNAIAGAKEIADAAMPKMLEQFEAIADRQGIKKYERQAARTAFLKKAMMDQANDMQSAAVKIQVEAAAQAVREADAMGLQGEERVKRVELATANLVRAKSKAYADEHKFETGGAAAETTKASIEALMSQKQSLEENISGLTKFADGGIITKLNASLPKAAAALQDFNTKLSTSTLNNAISATSGIVASVNELGSILASGDGATMKIGEKLQRFANGAGLGKSGAYEIKNKGIVLKLELNITMDAGEVERAIVMRKESILFDMLVDSTSTLSPTNADKIKSYKALVGG